MKQRFNDSTSIQNPSRMLRGYVGTYQGLDHPFCHEDDHGSYQGELGEIVTFCKICGRTGDDVLLSKQRHEARAIFNE